MVVMTELGTFSCTVQLLMWTLLLTPGPACGATSCDNPIALNCGITRETASGLAMAEEKFLSCARAPSAPRQERWRAPSAGLPLTRTGPKEGGSRLKRPSDVGSIINRCRVDEAKRSSPMSINSADSSSSARGKSQTPAWGVVQNCGAISSLSSARMEPACDVPAAEDEGDAMLESPILLSSTRSDSAQYSSLSAQATPACYSQTRANSLGYLGKSDLKSAGADTPHLRASDWTLSEHMPEPIRQRGPLSKKLFSQDDLNQVQMQEISSNSKLLSAIKEAQVQQLFQLQQAVEEHALPTHTAESQDYEEEACMLLSNARVELQVLNERWKQAEEARLNQSAEAAVLRQELKTLQANVDTLETEKGIVYAELKSFQDKCNSLHAELVTAQGREHQGSLRCSALMAEKADAEDRLATWEKESQALQTSQHAILDDTDDTLDQQLQDERQQLWAHVSRLQLAATDAEQIQASQRQQLAALCNALEASEAEREHLQGAVRCAEERCDALASEASSLSKDATRAADKERELETLVLRAETEAAETRQKLENFVTRCHNLETQLTQHQREQEQSKEQHVRLTHDAHALEMAKREVEERLEKLIQTHGVSVKSFEDELGVWRVQVQELKAQLIRAHQQADERIQHQQQVNEECMRQFEMSVQQQADERMRVLQDAGAARLEGMEKELELQKADWLSEVAKAREELHAAAGNIEDKERAATDMGRQVKELHDALKAAQQQHAESLNQVEHLQRELCDAQLRERQQQAAYQEQVARLHTLQEQARELEARVAALADDKVQLEQRQRDSMATIASQQQMLNESEMLKDRYAQVQIELANMQHDKAKLERDMQSRQGNAKDMEVRLDSAAAESAAMLRRCEELRLAYENATGGKRELEQEVKLLKSELAQAHEQAADKDVQRKALELRTGELEVSCERHLETTQAHANKIQELQRVCEESKARETEISARCKEAERVARDATRSASKELYLIQAQASHLRQQLDVLSKDKEAVLRDREAALREKDALIKEKQALLVCSKQRDQEVARLMEHVASLQLRQQPHEAAAARTEAMMPAAAPLPGAMGGGGAGLVAGAGAGGIGGGCTVRGEGVGEDVLQSVIAQRTRRRTLLESCQKTSASFDAANGAEKAAGTTSAALPPGCARAGDGDVNMGLDRQVAGGTNEDAEWMQSVVARRTRGNMRRAANDNLAYLLRHVPVPGVQAPVDIPASVELSHTGFIIGRLGADLSLTSGYVSRKHAQIQRTAAGWRVLDTSTNGLCVNNVKVRSQQLQDGDILLFEVPQTVGFGQEVPKVWEEKSHFRFRFCLETKNLITR